MGTTISLVGAIVVLFLMLIGGGFTPAGIVLAIGALAIAFVIWRARRAEPAEGP